MFRADLHAPSVIINKISASELSRKFTKSAGVVGWVGGWREEEGDATHSLSHKASCPQGSTSTST